MNYDLNSIGSLFIIIGSIGYFHQRRRQILIKNKILFDPDENIFEPLSPEPKLESKPDLLKKLQSFFGIESENNKIKKTRYIEENPRTIGLIELKMKVFILIALLGFILLIIEMI